MKKASSAAKTTKLASESYESCEKIIVKPMGDLEKLPVEIRKIMLLHWIGERVAPQKEDRISANGQHRVVTILTRGADHRHMGKNEYDCTGPSPVPRSNEAVFALNKAISALASQVLNENTVKVYPAPKHLLHKEAHFNFLRRLQLCFTNREYIDFFRVNLPPFNQDPSWTGVAGAAVLKKLELLNDLETFFRPPTSRKASPWHDSSLSMLFRCTPRTRSTHAFHEGYIPKGVEVKVTAYVKTMTKEKWERMLNDKTSTDHKPSIEQQKAEIRGTRNIDLPPECLCHVQCEYREINQFHEESGNQGLSGFDVLKYGQRPHHIKRHYRSYRFDHGDDGFRGRPSRRGRGGYGS
ncbi:hypothetical protein LTR56_009821 [Elasticomyces elasticus]|nr:hypothetical protein LTR56_009821 [Elasticomyces elasticus]KAK3659136.1 hypothetical protein LTR22_008599 [Elasticomyces elasticus]KAK4923186.1 hypothetical protein LTR49_009654 [Elasticomyces elasticus]KAK5761571.1 hypothetical protein LTS12_008363 [Elasticomyces elasticus]